MEGKPMYESRQKDFIWGAMIGGAIGIVASLFFTTKKGQQIQQKIADTYEDLEKNLSDRFSDAKDKVSDAKDKVEEEGEHLHKKVAHKTRSDHHHHKESA
jgi:gas vesicle protein